MSKCHFLLQYLFSNRFKVKCASPEGAFLALPEGGILLYAKNSKSYKKLAAIHAESWYKSVMEQRDVPNGGLWLVTGCMKSKSWGITTFSEPSKPGNVLQFTSSMLKHSKYYWKPENPNASKVGPVSKDIQIGRAHV